MSELIYVLKWASCLGLLPLYNPKTNKVKCNKFSLVILGLFVTLLTYYLTNFMIVEIGKISSAFILYLLSGIIATFINVITVFGSMTYQVRHLRAFLKKLMEIDKVVYWKNAKFKLIKFIFFNVMVFGFACYAIHSTVETGTSFIYHYLQTIWLFLGVTLQIYLLDIIKLRFRFMNKAIDNFIKRNFNSMDSIFKIRKIIEVHSKSCDLINLFNTMFSKQILLLFLTAFIHMLSVINFIITEKSLRTLFTVIMFPLITFLELVSNIFFIFY